MRILICDDEPQIVRALRVILRDAGYEVIVALDLRTAREIAAREPLDGAIVDLVLPDGSGIELCRALRAVSEMAIVVVSGLTEEDQKVAALRAGADDYLVKPFSPGELLARLEAVLRRAHGSSDERVVLSGRLMLDLAARTLTRDGNRVKLTPTEFHLLAVLVRNRGRIVTGRSLLREVWGPGHEQDAALLRTHVANLRRKLGRERDLIETRPGAGYWLME